jgi:hypothetical protein
MIRPLTTRNLLSAYFPQNNSKSVSDVFQRSDEEVKRKEKMGRNKMGMRREKKREGRIHV